MQQLYKGWVRWSRVGWNFQTQWDQLCAEEAINGHKTTLQDIAGLLITVMDDWEQSHNNATLLKPAKHCLSVLRTL